MTTSSFELYCAGCGASVAVDEPFPFRCPNARPGDDIDHVVTVAADLEGTSLCTATLEPDANPFLRFRELHASWRLASRRGMSDTDYVDLVERLDEAVAQVDGHGFRVTPYQREEALSDALGFGAEGGVWVKNETGNVAGSHKARHLMGIALYLEVVERTGLATAGATPKLGIASCGNAALAAAVVARAAGRPLEVFIPPWADAKVVARLEALGAELRTCDRSASDPPGDPCYLRFSEAVRGGQLPFTCQGSENGLTIEGGKTLGWELACQHAALGAPSLQRLFVQVGGGALASSCIQALRDARALGVIAELPKIHAVQTEGGHPLERSWLELTQLMRDRSLSVDEAISFAARHRSRFMWPWEKEPKSAASGILDDETYDWLQIVRAMIESGGSPVVVSETTVVEALRLARESTGIDVDATGSSGLAGLLALREQVALSPDARVAVLFTGRRR